MAGHRGMVGSAVVRRLTDEGYTRIITRTHQELDLTRQEQVDRFLEQEKPEIVILAAANVGGILANNTYRAEFIYQNTMIAANVIHAAWKYNVRTLLNLGSSCIYPRNAPQPMKEDHLLTGPLEPTNEPYAIAKIAAIKLCRSYHEQYGCNFFSAMPCNLYGPGDNYDPETSHVLAALVRKAVEARQSGARSIIVWGDGTPLREFLHVDDLADAVLFLLREHSADSLVRRGLVDRFVNVGSGQEVSIRELAQIVCRAAGFEGELEFDTAKPNGTPRKLMDSACMTDMGWGAQIPLEAGVSGVVASSRAE